jgi:hypothetical protein
VELAAGRCRPIPAEGRANLCLLPNSRRISRCSQIFTNKLWAAVRLEWVQLHQLEDNVRQNLHSALRLHNQNNQARGFRGGYGFLLRRYFLTRDGVQNPGQA